MKQFFYMLFLLPALLAPVPSSNGQDQEIPLIEDSEAPDAAITNVTLAWEVNPEGDIAGYNLYYGRASDNYYRLVTVTGTTATVAVRGNRTTYFAVTAFNVDGVESEFSAEVQWP
jgi:hypothetical protein